MENAKTIAYRQADLFHKVGLNRAAGLHKLDAVCFDIFGRNYDENDGLFSEHVILLSAISLNPEFKIRSILEIGTFDGRTACLLSKLFPGAGIVTIDLPDKSKEYSGMYQRGDTAAAFAAARDLLLGKFPAVKFKQMNSINLFEWSANQFDLVWIDGAHGYPVVAMDIINSLRLATDGGLVLIDDVWTDIEASDPIYNSIGAYESLRALVSANAIAWFVLFHKRLSPARNVKGNRKYIGFFRKRSKRLSAS